MELLNSVEEDTVLRIITLVSAPSMLPIYGAAKLHMELSRSIMEIHKSIMGLHKSFMKTHNSCQIMNLYKLDE